VTEYTFTGTVTVDGVSHQVSADGTITPVTAPPAGGGGGGTTGGGGGGGTTGGGGGGGTSGGGGQGAGQCYFGIWDPASVNWNTPDGNPVGTWDGAAKFSAAPVKSVTYFNAWLGPFPTTLNQLAAAHGATVYLNIEPQNTWGGLPNPKMSDIQKGANDSYLTSIGNAIKAGGVDVWVTFAHEANGTWYPWGIQAVTPQLWVSTYQHVCQVIRAAAGGHAKMVWCPNNADVGPVAPYWPGAEYVDIAAFDGYLNQSDSSQTYASFVKQTPDQIRALGWTQPIWNAETGVMPGTNRTQRYTQFIADMHSDGLLGFTQWNESDFALSTSEIAAVCAAVNQWNQG
jgi:mannan endo-1,4-beta-mannosidase